MARNRVPDPGYVSSGTHCLEQIGVVVSNIWYFTEQGRASIETQYKTPAEICRALGVSRATAYRLIAAQPKRYWCCDMRDKDNPRCYAVLPTELVYAHIPRPVGNPNLHNGIYQQMIARKPRIKRR